MGPWMISLVGVGSICLTLGILYLAVARPLADRAAYLWFGLVALAAAANAYLEPWAYRATTVEQYSWAFKIQITVQILWWIFLTVFLLTYTRLVRRSLAFTTLALLGASALVHLVSPHGILFRNIESLTHQELPWGEGFALASGESHPLAWLGYLATLSLLCLVLSTTVRLWGDGRRSQAAILGAGLVLLMGALVHGTLVDLLIVKTPYLMSFAFLGLVGATGLNLSLEVARASQLAQKLVDRERRWRTLLEDVHLLVAGIDREGRIDYVNPEFERLSGYAADEVIGRPFEEILVARERQSQRKMFEQALSEGTLDSTAQTNLKTKYDEIKTVLWSNVVLSHEDEPAGVLSIGADMTEQSRAELARDKAMQEIEALKQKLERENLYLKEEIRVERGFSEIVGRSDALMYVLHKIEQVAPTDSTVLIEGETGVGKELVARAIHRASKRAGRPFVTVNCATLPANLIESELFGHEKGAFSGAANIRHGRFEVADGGTLLLDELGELPLELQTKLLRVLEDGEFQRLGSSKTLRVDVRVIASTNRDLRTEVDAGTFREDLFYRLNVYPITVPPLRDRSEDIAPLVRHFVQSLSRRLGRTIDEVPGTLIEELENYRWPGNVRELKNLLERAVITSPGPALQLPAPLDSTVEAGNEKPVVRTLDENERAHILAVLAETQGQIAGAGGAAEILDLPPSTLRSRIKKLGIQVERPTGS